MGRYLALVALLSCLVLPSVVESRVLFGRAMGPNCTVRAEQHECITNPWFMERDCANECKHLVFKDVDHKRCMHMARMCLGRNNQFDSFVFDQCNATCRHHFRNIEGMLSPSDLEVLIHALLPTVYSGAFVLLLMYQAVIYFADRIMLGLDGLKKRCPFISEKGTALMVYLCENQGIFDGFGPHAVGRLYVCGYYVVEGGLLVALMAIVVYIGPSIQLHRKNPKLLNTGYSLLTFYTTLDALFTLLKDLIIHSFADKLNQNHEEGPLEHHQPVYVEGELTCKKLAMLGVAMLFIQSSTVMTGARKAQPKTLLDAANADAEKHTPEEEAMLLAGRLLMAVIFCFVGFWETARVYRGDLHDPPDGHDILWPKFLQLLLVIPFTLGFKTKMVSQMLAFVLVLEAVTVWTFWREMYADMPTMFHALHSKDYFATNVAVAGGLLLLQEEGGGKWTLDAYLKKKD